MGRKIWGLVLVCLLAAPATAADEPDPFNVDFAVGWGDCYRPLEWTPVEVGVATTLKDPFGGTMTISADQDSMTRMVVRHKIVVTKDDPIRVPLVVRLAHNVTSIDLSIVDEKGNRRVSQICELNRGRGGAGFAIAMQNKDYLVGVVGRKGFGLGKLADMSAVASGGTVYVRDKQPKLVPWDWTGYKSLDVLVLYNPEWELIGPHQVKAIHEFVSNGGRCLIVLGGRGIPAESPIADLLPFKLSPPRQVTLNERDLKYDGTVRRSATVAAWGLGEKGQKLPAGWAAEKFGTSEALLAHGPHGYGKVAVLAFDPSELPDPKLANNCRFWAAALNHIDRSDKRINFQQNANTDDNNSGYGRYGPGYYYGYDQSRDSQATNQVLGHLLDIQELRPLSIWWVIGLLAVLALLLGPVDYLVLKKLDRLPLTWITSSCVIVLATVGAYFGVQAIRAGSMQVRAVTIVDVLQEPSSKGCEAWSTSYCGIFAPSSDRYRFESVPGGGWWSAASPMENSYYYGNRSLSARQVFCSQEDSGNLPQELPINIWSMQCMVNESAQATAPLTAKVSSEGRSNITAEITNNAKTAIASGYVLINGREMDIGRIEPGQTKTLSSSASTPHGSHSRLSRSLTQDNLYEAYGCWQRTAALNERLQNPRNAMVCARYDNVPLGYQVVPKDYKVDHIMIARVLVPVADSNAVDGF